MDRHFLIGSALVLLATPAFAFHDAGVAHCNGCHTMHNSQDGALVDPDAASGNPWLLRDATPSDVCLGCHATGLGAVFAVDPLNPAPQKGAGNFVFLLEDNLNDGHGGASSPIDGDAAGHNIVAPGYGLFSDKALDVAPGGSFPASVLGCTSCHDPHGNDDFRMLYGAGGVVQAGVATFANAAPVADGLSLFAGAEGPTSHTAYRGGMSAWCGNCHGDFHDNATDLIHPSGRAMGATIATAYGLYNGTTNNATTGTPGDPATSYLPEVPFEDPAVTTGSTAGPSASSQVSCVSCHRAHASSAPDAGRWDFSVTLLVDDGAESGSYAIPDPYGSDDQRSLCNKCHAKDAWDAVGTLEDDPGDPDPGARREREIVIGTR